MTRKTGATAAMLLLGLIFLVIMGGLAGSLALRDPRVVSDTVTIAAPDGVVYGLLTDLKTGWTQWSPLMAAAGKDGTALEYGVTTSGQGATVRWTGKAGQGSVTLTECVPPRRLSYQTTMSLGGMVAVGTIVLRPEDSRTVVSWKDELSVGSNPIWRWLAWAMDSVRRNNLNRGLAALKQASEGATH